MSLSTRQPEVCKILAKAGRGAGALHHIAAQRNERSGANRRVEKEGRFLQGSWGKGERGVSQAFWYTRVGQILGRSGVLAT